MRGKMWFFVTDEERVDVVFDSQTQSPNWEVVFGDVTFDDFLEWVLGDHFERTVDRGVLILCQPNVPELSMCTGSDGCLVVHCVFSMFWVLLLI